MTRPTLDRNAPDNRTIGTQQDIVQAAGAASGMRQFVRQHGAAAGAGAGAVAVIAIAVMFFIFGDKAPPPRRVQDFTIVAIIPPPPPPPPPVEQKLPEPEMIEQTPITDPEIKEEAKVEEPMEAPPDSSNEPPPGPLGLDQKADGPGDNFNLVGRPGGRGLLGGGGGGGRWSYYSAMVQQQMEAALRANPKTRNSVAQVQVRVWADATGRIVRVQVTSTGNAEIDEVIRNEVFAGITLREAPPTDMPMPVVTRVTMRRPG